MGLDVLFTYPFSGPEKGGIAACLPPLLEGCTQEGHCLHFFSQCWPGDTPEIEANVSYTQERFPTFDRTGFGFAPGLGRAIARRVEAANVVHSHGLWMYLDWATGQATRKKEIPHLISPHGMLEPWALNNSRRKKQLIRALFQDGVLARAHGFHALCEAEARNIAALGFNRPIAVVPNGVDLEEFSVLPTPRAWGEIDSASKDKRVLLFLARLHPKKGILPLLQAWKKVAADFEDWHLVVAGPDEGGHRAELENAVREFGLEARVSFPGLLLGTQKLAALSASEIFVLPSWSEGFSMALLEAMACAKPLIITPFCNFPEAVAAGAGLETQPTPIAIERTLREMLSQPPTMLQEMGQNGRQLVETRYTWPHIVREMGQVYAWCNGALAPRSLWDRR